MNKKQLDNLTKEVFNKLTNSNNNLNKKQLDNLELIAKTVHEINKTFCESLGDFSQSSWEKTPQNIRLNAIDGVKSILNGDVNSPEDSHESWLKFKENDGWIFGAVKNVEMKTHPNIVPYENLSEEDKLKDLLFVEVAKTLINKYFK